MTSSSVSAMLQLQGLPPLPRSLTGFSSSGSGIQGQSSSSSIFSTPSNIHQPQAVHAHPTRTELGHKNPHFLHHLPHGRPSPPVPPPRPQSRRSSSSGSSFRASPDHLSNKSALLGGGGGADLLRSSPRSLSSSPHSPHVDSGLGRSSADSFSEGRAFVRVTKSPPALMSTRLDVQLAQLKSDMNHLRQQDMALLGHLLQINQGIQDLRHVLIPPPQPAPSGVLPMFHSTPPPYQTQILGPQSSASSHSRHKQNKNHQQPSSQSSRLSILSSGASKFFSRRSSSDKLMAEALGESVGTSNSSGHGAFLRRREEREDESDSLSSVEFGDV